MRKTLCLAVALALTTLAACKKDKSEPAVVNGSGSATASGSAEPPPATIDAAPAAAAADPLAPYNALAASTEKCEGKACAVLAMQKTKSAPDEAMPLFKQGCESGDGVSCAMTAMGFEQGMGVAASPTTAAALYDKSCTMGYDKACYNLALMLASGSGIPEDMPRAVTLLEKACAATAFKACGSLGDYYLQQGDKAKALPLLQRGCDNKDQLSCETLPKAK